MKVSKALELYFKYRDSIKKINKISKEIDRTLDAFENLVETQEFYIFKRRMKKLMSKLVNILIEEGVITVELKGEE